MFLLPPPSLIPATLDGIRHFARHDSFDSDAASGESHELMSDYTLGALTMMTMMNLWQWLSRVAYQCVATGVCLSDERFCVAEKRGRNDKTARFVTCEMSFEIVFEVVTRVQQKCIVCSNTENKTYQSEWMIYYYNIKKLL